MDQFQVAEIKQKDNAEKYKVIDLCIHPYAFYVELQNKDKGLQTDHSYLSLADYLRWWPIMAMCSIAVKNENDPFKPEYIFPQFVLQYFLEDNVDDSIGIKYMSIKAGRVSKKHYETDYRIYTNYVIPIKSPKETKDGFCDILAKQFEVTNTVSGKEHQIISNILENNNIQWSKLTWGDFMSDKKADGEMNPLDTACIYTKSEIPLLYRKSPFRMIEKILSGDIMKDLSIDGKTV